MWLELLAGVSFSELAIPWVYTVQGSIWTEDVPDRSQDVPPHHPALIPGTVIQWLNGVSQRYARDRVPTENLPSNVRVKEISGRDADISVTAPW